VLGAERVAAQAGDRRRVHELGEGHRHAVPAAGLYQALQGRDEGAPWRHLQGRARFQETALHVDHQEGGPPPLEAVEVVDPLLPGTQALVKG
jgi:hypothetical protein